MTRRPPKSERVCQRLGVLAKPDRLVVGDVVGPLPRVERGDGGGGRIVDMDGGEEALAGAEYREQPVAGQAHRVARRARVRSIKAGEAQDDSSAAGFAEALCLPLGVRAE